jgi:hypothetical protein
MAIGFIDALTHNSTVNGYGLVESDEIQGGIRTSVDNLFELAKLKHIVSAAAIGQLKEYSSIVFVRNTDPLTTTGAANGDNTITVEIDGVDTFFEAPSTTNGIGKFYCLTDITLIETPNSDATLTVTDDNGTLTAAPAAWALLDSLVGGGGGGISDFSGVTYNDADNTIVTTPLVVGDGTLAFTFPTYDDVANVFNQGLAAGDSSIEIVDLAGGDAPQKRIRLKINGQHQGRSLRLFNGDAVATTYTVGQTGYKTLLDVGQTGAPGEDLQSNIRTNFLVQPNTNDATEGNFISALQVSRTQGVTLGSIVSTQTVTDESGAVIAQVSGTKITNLYSDVLGLTSALVVDGAGQVFKKTLGTAAFEDITNGDGTGIIDELPQGVYASTVMSPDPANNATNVVIYDYDNGSAASTTVDTDGNGNLAIALNRIIQLGTDTAAGGLTIGTSTLWDSGNGTSSNLRVYGDTTIDGDLTVAGSLITTTTEEVSFEDNLLSLNVARESDGTITPNVSSASLQPSGIEVFHGSGTNINNARPYINYKYNTDNTLYGGWYLAHGYEVATYEADGVTPATYTTNPIEGRILSTVDVRVVPTTQQADDRFLYHDMNDTDAEENTLKFITTPYGLLKKYSRTESFTYTPDGGSESTYNQTFVRSYTRTSVVTVNYGASGSTSAPRPDGSVRIYHGLDLEDGFVHVVGIVISQAAGNLPVGSIVHPKVRVRTQSGAFPDEYKNSCDVFANGFEDGDTVKFVVMG